MKKKLFVIIGIILIAVLFVPIPKTSYDDGGTKEYQALTYKIVKWNKIRDASHTVHKTRVYWFPNNFKSISTLWNETEAELPSQNESESAAAAPGSSAPVPEKSSVPAEETTNQTEGGTEQAETTLAEPAGVSGNPVTPPSTAAGSTAPAPATYSGTTAADVFVITKANGTSLELRKLIFGEDTENSVYCCDLGGLDGSADMKFREGDVIALRYDVEIAETYPLQLTVREILPVS